MPISASQLELVEEQSVVTKGVFKSAVSGDFGRQVLDAPGAAALAQDVAVEWVTASALPLRGQQESTFLMDTRSSQFKTIMQLGLQYKTGSGFSLTSQM